MKSFAILSMLISASGCTPQFEDLRHQSYTFQGDFDTISSCLVREVESNHDRGEVTNIRQLTHPDEVRIGDFYRDGIQWQLNVTKMDNNTVSIMVSAGSRAWDGSKRVIFAPKFKACGLDLT